MLHPQIHTFLLTAEAGSFSKASEKMFLSKVSVMKQIDALEDRLGVRLFDRSNHGVALTDAGKELFAHAQKMRHQADEVLRQIRLAAGGSAATIRIGTSVLRPSRPLVELWAEIDDGTHPFRFEIIPFSDSPADLNRIFVTLGEEVDVIVGGIGTRAQMEGNRFVPLGSFRCCIGMSRKHRLAGRNSLTWDDLHGETMLLVRRGSTPVLDAMRQEIEEKHPQIRLADVQNPYDAAVFNTCEQMGCVMETLDAWAGVHPSLVTLPMAWDYEIPYGITCSAHPSPAVEEFVGTIEAGRPAAVH